MREIIIEVPNDFGKELKPYRVNSDIKGELVRCKDCKHWDEYISDENFGFCPCYDGKTKAVWFCADGEKRE